MERRELKTLLLLLLLRKEKMIGRYRLKNMLEMQQHEGVVRRILEDLTDKQCIKPTRSGCMLTETGEEYVTSFLREKGIVLVEQKDLRGAKIGPESVVIQLRNKKLTMSILGLRDIAVKMGAKGAVILAYKNRELGDPSAYRKLSARHPEINRVLKRNMELKEDDYVIVGFADTYPRALEGALAVGLEIDKSENEIAKLTSMR